MSLEEAKGIKFPDKHYVGFQARNKEGISLGFMTPYGTDAAAKKRMSTVDTWANSNYGNYNYTTKQYEKPDAIPAIIYDNKPMTGFKVSHTVNHSSSWNSCRDKWRILDPRGFELEITSGNFERVLEFTDILRGEIQGECIWARLGANNVLVPVGTDIYRNAMDNTGREFIASHSFSERDNEGELQYDVFTFWHEKKNNRAVQLKLEERFKVLVFND